MVDDIQGEHGAWLGMREVLPHIRPTSTLVGDIADGAMYLAVGMLAAALHTKRTGPGQIVDAAIVDGLAHMQTLLHSLVAAGQLQSGSRNQFDRRLAMVRIV